MNRWWGSAEDSARQASDRSSRQARRIISRQNQILSSGSDEDTFDDANQSLSALNLDGEPGDLDQPVMTTPAEREIARQRSLPV